MRTGIIGTNFISREFLKAAAGVEGISPAAVFSRNTETGEAFAENCPGMAVFTDYDAMLQSGIDAVYIAAPNAFHAGYAEKAIEKGKHVFVEKPAFPDEKTFVRLFELAEKEGVVLFEGMRTIYTPGYGKVKESLFRAGTIRNVSLSYCQYSSRYDKFKNGIVENAFNPKLCNGSLMDIGVYCCAMLTDLFGLPETVQTSVLKLPNGLDAAGTVLCSYPGKLATLTFSKIADGRNPCEIQGENGTILFTPPTNPKKIIFRDRGGAEEILYLDENGEFFGMEYEIRRFLELIRGDAENRACMESTRKTLHLMDTIRTQAGIDFS